MKYYTITLRLDGAPSNAVAVEWTNQSASLDGGPAWEPCLRLADGAWKFSSREPFGVTPPHERAPGAFGDLAIRYRLTAAGPWSEASADRKEVMIIEATEESQTGEPLPAAPILAVAPILAGLGKIGSEVTVTSGLWSGHAAPQISFQWRRAGVAIPGAVSRAYVLAPADDLTAVDCVVTARNAAGETVAITTALVVTYPAPAVAGDLPDEIFDEDTGPQLVETDFVFLGENLEFTASSGVIDPLTGVLTVSTDQPVSGRTITVTAANSGGQASASVQITVEAAPVVSLKAPAPFGATDVAVVRSDWRPAGQSADFSPILSFPKLTPDQRASVQIQFRASPLTDVAAIWHTVAPLASEPGRYWLPDSFDTYSAWPTVNLSIWKDNARRFNRLRFRHRFSDAQNWSEESVPFTIPLPVTTISTDPAPWRTVSTASQLVTAILEAPGGAHIAIVNGSVIADCWIQTDVTKATPVVIRPVDRLGAEVIIRRMYFRTTSGSGRVAKNLHFEDLTFRGNLSVVADGGTWPQIDAPATGIWVQKSDGLKFENCTLDYFDVLMEASHSKNLTITRCNLTGWGNDCIRAYGNIEHVIFTHNKVFNPAVNSGWMDDYGRHPDVFQMSATADGVVGKDVYIAFNDIDGGDIYCQIFYLNSERGNSKASGGPSFPGAAHQGIRVFNNFAVSAHTGGCVIGAVTDWIAPDGTVVESVIERNVFRFKNGKKRQNNPAHRPGISLKGNNKCKIINNVHSVRNVSDATQGIRMEISAAGGPAGSLGTNSSGNKVVATGNVKSETAFPVGWIAFTAGRRSK